LSRAKGLRGRCSRNPVTKWRESSQAWQVQEAVRTQAEYYRECGAEVHGGSRHQAGQA